MSATYIADTDTLLLKNMYSKEANYVVVVKDLIPVKQLFFALLIVVLFVKI